MKKELLCQGCGEPGAEKRKNFQYPWHFKRESNPNKQFLWNQINPNCIRALDTALKISKALKR